tara:strand:- start:492 stop:722 length:231 start_codon:yes stop_codon:yes gene_type:complete
MTKTAKQIGQRFKPGDRVKETPAFGMEKDGYDRRKGTIQKCTPKKNKAGREHFYYDVLWDGHQHPTNRAQNRLSSI